MKWLDNLASIINQSRSLIVSILFQLDARGEIKGWISNEISNKNVKKCFEKTSLQRYTSYLNVYRKITIFKVCALWSFMHIWSIIAIHTSRNVLCGCMYVLKYYLEHAWIDRKQLEKIFLFFLIITFKVRHASFERENREQKWMLSF